MEEKIFWDASNETLFLEKFRENCDLLLTNDNSDVSINDKITTFSSFFADKSMHVFGKTVKSRTCELPPPKKENQTSLIKNANLREKILHGQETAFLKIKMMRLDKNSCETALSIIELKPKRKKIIKGKKVKSLMKEPKNNLENFGKR